MTRHRDDFFLSQRTFVIICVLVAAGIFLSLLVKALFFGGLGAGL